MSWYTWLEQGRDINVSEAVLDAVSRALQLQEFERAHLYRLAGLNPPQPTISSDSATLSRLQRVVTQWAHNPAYVIDKYWNILVANDAARSVFALTNDDHNCLVTFFTNPEAHARNHRADEVARELVAQFRAEAARFPGDPGFAKIASRLAERSPLFAALWARHEVRESFPGTKVIEHPDAGKLTFEYTTLAPPDRTDLRLVLYLPQPGTDTERKLERLLRTLIRTG